MFVREIVKRLAPYTPGEQPKAGNVVKLNTNENPYPPSPRCAETLAGFDMDRLRRYPDPVFSSLRKELAKIAGAKPENVFVGNGSDEILSLAARAFVEDGEAIGSLDPSYSLYRTLADIRGVEWRGFNSPAAVRGTAAKGVSLFLLTNPNAPTGGLLPRAEVEAFTKRFRGVVVVDEAYADFARENCLPLAAAPGNRNVIVMRTFSKSYSLAGLRAGWCAGPAELIDALYKIKDSYNVDALAQAVALAAARDRRWMRANVRKVVATRGRLVKELRKRGWDVMPSEANFIFARPAHAPAAELFARLRENRIYTRYFPGPGTGDRIRITIGTDAQTDALLAAIDRLDVNIGQGA